MSVEIPLVSVGVPVYNGEATVARSLQAIQRQTYPNLEIIIGDNASEDDTEQICRNFAEGEPRCTYLRSELNRGGPENFSSLFRRSTGDYFIWVSDDDLLDKRYIEHGVKFLESNPEVVLAAPSVRGISPDSKDPFYSIDTTALGREVQGISRLARSYTRLSTIGIYGLFRSSAVKRSALIKPLIGSDTSFMQEIALLGPIETNPLQIFKYYNRESWNTKEDDRRAFLGDAAEQRIGFPALRLLADRISRVGRLEVSRGTRGVFVVLLLLLEVRRVSFMLLNRLERLVLSERLHRRWIKWAYWRWLHNEDVRVHDPTFYFERIVMQRFSGRRRSLPTLG